ncbi:hypothetical protein A9P82_08740 [Arachidicoccus ginsenosidimutans]|nr:hypothetical protein A9P82_08740 [Arachidicoccus sp. BS20]
MVRRKVIVHRSVQKKFCNCAATWFARVAESCSREAVQGAGTGCITIIIVFHHAAQDTGQAKPMTFF